MKTNRPQPRVSVIVPTRNRLHLLPKLIEHFHQQTWENKELLILDDTPAGKDKISKLQLQHPPICIWHVDQEISIGTKRNLLIERASGTLIAHFDDDDFYAPTYLEFMALELLKSNSDLVKLAGWFCFHQESNTLGYWDTTRQDLPHTVFAGDEPTRVHDKSFTALGHQSFLTGYGFSYVYRKQAWETNKFRDINLGEDSRFHEDILKRRGKTQALQDAEGHCIHIIHKSNTSRCFPNHIIPNAIAKGYIKSLSKMLVAKPNTRPEEPQSKAQQNIHFYSTTTSWPDNAPTVSICTLTYNRNHFLPLLQACIEKQDYPHTKLEWLILDDSSDQLEDPSLHTNTDITIKYQRVKQKLTLGKKRNLSHQLCSGDYIVYMDDDDYYYPTRVSHAVSSLQQSGKPIAGSTLLQIYFCHDQQLWLSGPFGQNHATANTFAMTKEFARSQHYKNEDTCNEEKYFLNSYKIPMTQLDPRQTIICISHKSNTFDKKKMRGNKGKNPRLNKLETSGLPLSTKNKLEEYQRIYRKTNQ